VSVDAMGEIEMGRSRFKQLGRRALEGMGRRFGLAVIPRWRLGRLDFAQQLARLAHLLNVDWVIDVGANNGQFRDFLRAEVGWRGAISSFEPIPEIAAELRRRAAQDPGWTIHEVALGATNGNAVFNVAASSDFSSFLTPNAAQVPEFADLSTTVRRVDVELRRLDCVLNEVAPSARRIFLKLDTQGFDLEVLAGLGTARNQVALVQTEMSVRPVYNNMPDWQDSLATLNGMGFDLSGLFPVTHDSALRLVEFDCIAINSAFIGNQPVTP
jgi:FkbM family methyltransferase